jgi:hypothetical protein
MHHCDQQSWIDRLRSPCQRARLKPFLSVDTFDSVLLAWRALVDEPGLKASGFMTAHSSASSGSSGKKASIGRVITQRFELGARSHINRGVAGALSALA